MRIVVLSGLAVEGFLFSCRLRSCVVRFGVCPTAGCYFHRAQITWIAKAEEFDGRLHAHGLGLRA